MITNNPNTSHHQKTKSSSLKVKNQIRPSTSPSPSPAPSSVASSISSTQTLHQLPLPLPLPPSLSLPTTNTNTTITTTPIHHHNLKVTFETINFDFTSILKLISKSSSHQSRPKFNQLIQFLSTLSLPTHQPQSQSTAQQQQQITISPSPSKPSIQLTKPLDHLVILIDSIQPHLKSNIDRSLIHAIGDLIYSLHIIYHSNLSPSNIHLVNLWAQIHHHSQHIIQLTEEINLLQPKMLHPYQQIPNRPTTFDEKYQGDLENILSAIDRLYTHSPQLSNQRAQRKLPSKDLLSLDLVISSIERTTARRLDTQRASLPTLVSQGVAAMGWCVDSTLEKQGPAELELLDRLERAGSRRYTNQCSRIPPIDEQPSLMTLYTQSMRETDAMETILTKTGEGRMSNQDALLRKNRLSTPISLATSTLSRSAVEPDTATIDYDDMTSDQIGLLIGSQFPSPPSRDTHRSQSMPNIFKKNRTHSSPPQKRGLFGKKSSNPPNPTTFNSRDSQEDPFRMPSLLDYPLTNLLDDITNQDLPHGSNDVPSPAGGSNDRKPGSGSMGNRSSSKSRNHERLAMAA